MKTLQPNHSLETLVSIPVDDTRLIGQLTIPPLAQGIVVFAHGSGSSRHSPRNQYVAKFLQDVGLATLLFDLLTPEEEVVDRQTRQYRFDIALLAERLMGATDWLGQEPATARLNIGYFGASTGSAATLLAAAAYPDLIQAIVSRGGRPDLAGTALTRIEAPTLLIVGGLDPTVLGLNRLAMQSIQAPKRIEIVPGATHLFEEPGTLEEVAWLASQWFEKHLSTTVQNS
jgi:putative phosphoribosyl transferase